MGYDGEEIGTVVHYSLPEIPIRFLYRFNIITLTSVFADGMTVLCDENTCLESILDRRNKSF